MVEDLKKYWIIKIRATLALDKRDDTEVSILSRIVRWDTEGVEYEVDPRRVDKLLRGMGMESCRERSSPCVKLTTEDVEKLETQLTGDAIALCRSGVPRCDYLSANRPGILFESKELCQAMSKPTESDIVALKHLCRYPKGRPRLRLAQRIPSSAI